jgi:hypothetical protein
MNRTWTYRIAVAIGTASLGCLFLAFAASKPKPLSSYDAQVKPLLAKMTLDEKIGQMTQAEQAVPTRRRATA